MEYQKTVVATGDLIGNKFDNRITKVSKNSERVTHENDKEIPKEKCISPKERQKINVNQKLINFLDTTPNHPTNFSVKN